MPVKFVAEVLKGVFGTSEQSADDVETETSITVERESNGESPDESQETVEESPDKGQDSEEPAESVEDSEEPAESVEAITGIGPTYSERLSAVGIETVGDLVGADEAAVAEAAEVSESRAADWVTQAEDW